MIRGVLSPPILPCPRSRTLAPQRPVWGMLVRLGERLGLHRAAGKVIETDLDQPHLDGVTAHIDRG